MTLGTDRTPKERIALYVESAALELHKSVVVRIAVSDVRHERLPEFFVDVTYADGSKASGYAGFHDGLPSTNLELISRGGDPFAGL
jgi:hypothetical protein